MESIVKFICNSDLKGNLPHHICTAIRSKVVWEIREGEVRFYSNIEDSDRLTWIKNCKEELRNSSLVKFTWKGEEKQCLFIPRTTNARGYMSSHFDSKGTWYTILYNKSKNDFLIYCNCILSWDLELEITNRFLKVNKIINLNFQE